MTPLEAALDYAARGLHAFPVHGITDAGACDCGKPSCKSPGKHPLTSDGFKSATTDAKKIKTWWTRHPGPNVAIRTGAESGIIVLDIDGPEGESFLKDKNVPPTPTAKTGKGRHIFFQHPGGMIKNAVRIAPAIDIRGDGGYVVAAPSKHVSGAVYSWFETLSFEETPLADAPTWLLDLMQSKPNKKRHADTKTGAVLDAIIVEGERNAMLTSLAGSMRRRNMGGGAILAALLAENARLCRPPLSEPEVQRIAEGIKRYPAARPWFDGAAFLPAVLAQEIAREQSFLTSPIDDAGVGVCLYVYENGVYRPGGADMARRRAHNLLGAASKNDRIEGTVALTKEGSKVASSELNPFAMDLLNVKDGMLDWRTGKLKLHSPKYRSTFQIAATYTSGERSEALDKFLSEVFPPDALLLAEELVGYLLRPTTKFQKAFMLLGAGANGKSTFLSMLTAFLGEDCVSNVSLQDLVQNRFKLAELLGKLVNIYADIPSSSLEQSDIFKAVVAGDTVTPERKFGHPFKMVPTARLLFSANDLPKSHDLSPAYFRRWEIIPFPNKFEGTNAKKDLLGLLTTPQARNALLRRGVDGLRRLETQQAFTVCGSVKAAGETYRRQCDPAFEFISERLDAIPRSVLGKAEVYEMFKQWSVAEGKTSPDSQIAFNKRLTQVFGAGVAEKRIQRAGRFERVWIGLGWKAEADE